MLKSDRWIRKTAREHDMINPFSEKQVREGVISYGLSSYGYDLRVADEFKIFTNVNSTIVDPKNFDEKSFVTMRTDICIVPPNSFALARSVEYFKIPRDILTICVGKSTYARCGIIVNVTPVRARVGRLSSLSKSRTPRHCRRASTPTKAFARFCSSSPTKSAKPATPTVKANISRSKGLCCRNCEREENGREPRRRDCEESLIRLAAVPHACGGS